jgi:hypothetical protein
MSINTGRWPEAGYRSGCDQFGSALSCLGVEEMQAAKAPEKNFATDGAQMNTDKMGLG